MVTMKNNTSQYLSGTFVGKSSVCLTIQIGTFEKVCIVRVIIRHSNKQRWSLCTAADSRWWRAVRVFTCLQYSLPPQLPVRLHAEFVLKCLCVWRDKIRWQRPPLFDCTLEVSLHCVFYLYSCWQRTSSHTRPVLSQGDRLVASQVMLI